MQPTDIEDLRQRIATLPNLLAGLTGVEAINTAINDTVLQQHLMILTDRHFLSLVPAERDTALETIFLQLISSGNLNAHIVGGVMASLFSQMRQDQTVELASLMRLYDYIYGLYWVGSADFLSMARFDGDVVRPFSDWLKSNVGEQSQTPSLPASGERNLRICYFCHHAHTQPGNAVAPHILSLASKHLQFSHEVFVYCVQWFDDAYIASLKDAGVQVKTFKTATELSDVETICTALETDGIDVIITDQSSSIATYVFSSRAAPIQMWLELGMPYWSIRNLDWTFLAHKDHRADFGIPAEQCSPLRLRQDITTLKRDFSLEDISETRKRFPDDVFLFGVFTRFSKITDVYLTTLEKIISMDPRAHLVIAGSGDPLRIARFIASSAYSDRFTFIQNNIDVGLYGCVIDVFTDTFPFCGGNSCREVMSSGTPVLSMYSHDWNLLSTESRDPELIARSTEIYISIAQRLMSDADFRERKSKAAVEIAGEESDASETVVEIERRIQALVRKKRGDKPRSALSRPLDHFKG